MKIVIFSFIMTIFLIGMTVPSFAHTTVEVEKYKIEVGWGIEPPIVGIRNDFVFKITESGETEGSYKGVTNAFKNVDAVAMYGGATKQIDISSDPRPGYYFSSVIPTKTGSYIMDLKGEIDGTVIEISIPIEDVESASILNFPPSTSEGAGDITSLKNVISSLQQDVSKLKSGDTAIPSNDSGTSYDFAILGLSIGSAAIILAIIALIKRK